MATSIQRRVHNPVRVRSHAGEYKEKVRDKEYFIPGHDGVVMERAEATMFLAQPSPRTDAYGNITPKALTYECEYCSTPYPSRTHPCFVSQVEALGILQQPDECNLCGKQIHEVGGMDRHIDKDHKGARLKQEKAPGAPSEDVVALKSELADLKLLVGRMLTEKNRSVESSEVAAAEVEVPEADAPVPQAPVNAPRSIRELGERFLSKRDEN